MPIKEFMDRLERIKTIHEKKSQDYAVPDNPFQNFERSAQIANWFNDPIDKVFITLISTKLARLATLLNSGKAPNNESVADGFDDLTIYSGLWGSYREYVANQARGATFEMTGNIIDKRSVGLQCKQCGISFYHRPVNLYAKDDFIYYFHDANCRDQYMASHPKDSFRLF